MPYCSPEFAEMINDLVQKARLVHKAERGITLQSVELCWELHRWKAAYHFCLSNKELAKEIGLTLSVYDKRRFVGKLFEEYPKARQMFVNGETEISCLGVIAGKLTEANADIIFDGIRGKSKMEVEAFSSCVDDEGNVWPEKEYLDLNARLRNEQPALYKRLCEVLGKDPSVAEILETAFKDCLEKRDPMKKAERAQARAEKKNEKMAEEFAPARIELQQEQEKPKRTAIPMRTQHAVWLRDKGQCTYIHADGSRCTARSSLQIDHILMVCRNGNNELSNLRLLCFKHNLWEAERNLGGWFLEKRKEWAT